MSLFKCKMCGGALEINDGATVATCEYCGTQQTLPKLENEKRANMYDRANHFRRNNDFDKAMSIYESILNEDSTDAEAYWSLVLCRYGIEYVEDPLSHKRLPTVNRAQFTSIFDDEDYKSAIANADIRQRAIYESEATEINEIQKGILAISQKEEPFDVFICYKETDSNGRRTPDSVLAQELYYGLKDDGFKVFFSRITLEDKLGSAYEPYIFAALNSAKVMVVLGTRQEHFNAVWVKNEWSRFLSLIKSGSKKVIIPAYKDMNPYDLPEEFSHLQAQDMSKLGFMQDLIRGIKKLVNANEPKTVVKETVVSNASAPANIAPLLERAFMFLEDGEWDNADKFCEQVLNQDPKNAEAYLGKLMAELHVKSREALKDHAEPFDDNNNYVKVLRFGNDKLKNELEGAINYINSRNENARLDGIYNQAMSLMSTANSETKYYEAAEIFRNIAGYKDAEQMAELCVEKGKECTYHEAIALMNAANTEAKFIEAADRFRKISGYKDSDKLLEECLEKAEVARKDKILNTAKAKMFGDSISQYEEAIRLFESIPGWKYADENVRICQEKIDEIKAKTEAARIENKRLAEIARKEEERKAKRKKKIVIITAPIVCAIIAFFIVLNTVIMPSVKENASEQAEKEYLSGNVQKAYEIADKNKLSIAKAYKYVLDGKYADAVNNGLTNIVIPNSTTSIGINAFYGCPSLESVTIPNGVKHIGNSAFSACSSLTDITISNSVTSIDNYAFSGCLSLKRINFKGTKAQWKQVVCGDGWDNFTGDYTVHCTDGTIQKSETTSNVAPEISIDSYVSEPTVGQAYKLMLIQNNLGKILFATTEIDLDKYYATTEDIFSAPDFFVEKATGGYKFYTMIDGTKSYVHAYLFGSSKRLKYDTNDGSVWYYKADCKAWFTVINGCEYVLETYSAYPQILISDSNYINSETTGVTQFPANLIISN